MSTESKPELPHAAAHSLKWKLILLLSVLAGLIALAAAWSWSPLRHWLDIERIVSTLQILGQSYGVYAAILAFAVALSLAVPLTFLTLVTLVAFGPVAGFFYTMVAAMVGATVSYGLGLLLGREVVQRLGGERVNNISQRLANRGILAVVAIRMVPVAPFAVINMIAGASHIRLRDLLLGTAIGMTPGTLVMVLFIDQIIEAMKRPSSATALMGVLMLALIAAGVWGFRRWLR
jgi:uncharacterized membrane protein YdjX (TVP38/TMEM64 family)